jgi:hypothetical protein
MSFESFFPDIFLRGIFEEKMRFLGKTVYFSHKDASIFSNWKGNA